MATRSASKARVRPSASRSPAAAKGARVPVAPAAATTQVPAYGKWAEEEGPAPGALRPPRWVPPASMVITILAVLDSAYLTYAHFTTATALVCPTHGFINCLSVTTSSYSHPFGIPVAVAGLAWSVGMLALCSPWAWRAASPWVSRARLAGSAVGVLTVFYLLWAELLKLHHLCEYCTGVHILTVALFFVVVFGTALAVPPDEDGAPLDESA